MDNDTKQSARRRSRGRSRTPSPLPDENSGGQNLQRTRSQSRSESPPPLLRRSFSRSPSPLPDENSGGQNLQRTQSRSRSESPRPLLRRSFSRSPSPLPDENLGGQNLQRTQSRSRSESPPPLLRRRSRGRSRTPSPLPDENSGGQNLQRTRARSRSESPPLGPTTRVRGGPGETCRTRKHPRPITCTGCIANIDRDSDPSSRLKERSCSKLWLKENCGSDPKLCSIRDKILEWERRRHAVLPVDETGPRKMCRSFSPVIAREAVTPVRKRVRRSLSCGDIDPTSSSVTDVLAPVASAPVASAPAASATTTDPYMGWAGWGNTAGNAEGRIHTSHPQHLPLPVSDMGRAGWVGSVGNVVEGIRTSQQWPIPGKNKCDGVMKGHNHSLLS